MVKTLDLMTRLGLRITRDIRSDKLLDNSRMRQVGWKILSCVTPNGFCRVGLVIVIVIVCRLLSQPAFSNQLRADANESQKLRNKKQNGLAHLRFFVCVTPKQKKKHCLIRESSF